MDYMANSILRQANVFTHNILMHLKYPLNCMYRDAVHTAVGKNVDDVLLLSFT